MRNVHARSQIPLASPLGGQPLVAAARHRRFTATAAVIALSLALPATAVTASVAQAASQDKVGVCHRTGSESNPYVFITVPAAQANGHITGDEKQHNHSVTWRTAGVVNGVTHAAGDERLDFFANSAAQCSNQVIAQPPPAPPKPPVQNLPAQQAPQAPAPPAPQPPQVNKGKKPTASIQARCTGATKFRLVNRRTTTVAFTLHGKGFHRVVRVPAGAIRVVRTDLPNNTRAWVKVEGRTFSARVPGRCFIAAPTNVGSGV